MKKHFTALFLLISLTLTFFIPANAKDYTVNDILNISFENITRVTLGKDYHGYGHSYASLETQQEIRNFENIIGKMNVQKIIDHRDRTNHTYFYLAFTTGDKIYRYDNREGFSIQTSASQEEIKIRYVLSEQDIESILNNSDYKWSSISGVPSFPSDQTWDSYCRFQNDSNIYSVQQPDSSGSVNRKEYKIDENPLVVPYLEEETLRTMLPLRCFATLFEFQVGWNEQTEEILLTKEPYQITMKLGSKLVKAELRNGSEILWTKDFEMETPAVTRFDRTFVPVRFLGELFGHNVTYGTTGPNSGIAIGISRPRPTKQFLDIFPYMETEQGKRTFGLDILNSHKLPFLFPFSEEFQMNIRIYDLSGNLVSETRKPAAETDNYLLLPPEQNIRTGCSVQTELEPGSYYADIKLNLPDFPDTYRMFFEAE